MSHTGNYNPPWMKQWTKEHRRKRRFNIIAYSIAVLAWLVIVYIALLIADHCDALGDPEDMMDPDRTEQIRQDTEYLKSLNTE